MTNAPASDRAVASTDNAAPDGDPFLDALETRHIELIERQGLLEVESFKLPKEPKSDDDVALITAWVVKADRLRIDAEKARKVEKADFLELGRKVDGLFNGIGEQMSAKARKLEQRSAPYLETKRIAAEAAAAEVARVAKIEADRLAAIAEEQQAELDRQRDALQAEQDRLAGAATASAGPEGSGSAPDTNAVREQHAALQGQQMALEETQAASERATLNAEVAQETASGAGLNKTRGGGGNASTEKVWVAVVEKWPAVLASLGPLGQFFTEQIIRDAVDRAAKKELRPAIPGVRYSQEIRVKTNATRAGK